MKIIFYLWLNLFSIGLIAQNTLSFYVVDRSGDPLASDDILSIEVKICDLQQTVLHKESFSNFNYNFGLITLNLNVDTTYDTNINNYYSGIDFKSAGFEALLAKISINTKKEVINKEIKFNPNSPYPVFKGNKTKGTSLDKAGVGMWNDLGAGSNLSAGTWDIYNTNRKSGYDGNNYFIQSESGRVKLSELGLGIEQDNKLKLYSGYSTSANSFLNILYNQNDKPAVSSGINTNQAGVISLYNPNGNPNIVMSTISGSNGNRPLIYFYRPGNNSPEIACFINDNNQGVIQGDLKNFRMDHPADETMDIVYASLEGPEAAAYVRGNATLDQGKVYIAFPDHFIHVCGPESLTVQLTPRSKDSKGLAVTSIDPGGFWVEELGQGQGNYAFYWEAKGVRNGYENYQVIQPKSRLNAAEVNLPKYK